VSTSTGGVRAQLCAGGCGSDLASCRGPRLQCTVSMLSMVAVGFGVYQLLGGNWRLIGSMYIVPLLVFNAWITLVTYLQVPTAQTIRGSPM
jgi:hypothetical protein